MASFLRVIAIGTTLVTFLLNQRLGWSWWIAIPIYFGSLIAYNGFRILIYERFISPIAYLPGPKARHRRTILIEGTLAVGGVPSD